MKLNSQRWTVDMFLRTLLAIDSEVVDREIPHTPEVSGITPVIYYCTCTFVPAPCIAICRVSFRRQGICTSCIIMPPLNICKGDWGHLHLLYNTCMYIIYVPHWVSVGVILWHTYALPWILLLCVSQCWLHCPPSDIFTLDYAPCNIFKWKYAWIM